MMENDTIMNVFKLSGKEEKIDTQGFIIEDNLLRFDYFTVQLSNISRVYAGKRKLKFPIWAILIFLISLFSINFKPWFSVLGLLISSFYLFYLYQDYQNNKLYLAFQLNSGRDYYLYFKDPEFLLNVRKTVEKTFNRNNIPTKINIAEQKIIQGNHQVFNGHHQNINTGIQAGNVIGSNNQTEQSTIINKDISGGTIQNAAFAKENTQTVETIKESSYDWSVITANLQALLASLNEESEVKVASQEALKAAEKQDKDQFEAAICEHRAAFLSDLFINTASGVLAQIINQVLGI